MDAGVLLSEVEEGPCSDDSTALLEADGKGAWSEERTLLLM